MTTPTQWLAGARPKTLPAAVAPVAAGTGAALGDTGFSSAYPGRAGLALLVAVALQVGVNYANDYSDGVRGTDDNRVGPLRLTGSGTATPRAVLTATAAAFVVAAAAGLVLVVASGRWWLLAVGVTAFPAAWFYTGGRRPYGYAGLGEVFVFTYFGLVAVLGTTYTQTGRVSWTALAAAIGIGCLACAILVVNNLRDIPTDTAANKRTLAVRLGDHNTRRLYLGLLTVPLLLILLLASTHPLTLLALASVVFIWPAAHTVRSGATGPVLIPALQSTGRAELAYGILLGLTLAVS